MDRRARGLLYGCGGGVVLAATLGLVFSMARTRGAPARDERVDAPPPPAAEVEPAAAPARTEVEVAPPATATSVALSGSLRGTDTDGALEVDARGAFLPTRAAIRTFDYFLSATGEESDAEVRAHVEAFARQRLPDTEARRAVRLFDDYVAYRSALAMRLSRELQPGDVRGALALARDAQRAQFGASDAERLFGLDNQLAETTLDRDRVLTSTEMDDATRTAALAAIEARLPAPLRVARAERWAVEEAARLAARARPE